MSEPCRFEKSVSPVLGLDVCVAHKSHSVLICDIALAELRAENERLRTWPSDVMAALEAENETLRAKLEAIAAWSPVSGRPCPLCTYQEGKFIAPCAWHRETDDAVKEGLGLTVELEQRTEERDALRAEIGDVRSQLAQRRVSVPFPYQRDAPPRRRDGGSSGTQ